MDEKTKVAIVGAGPAGLAVGACLRKAGLEFVILEKEQQIAPAWRRHYHRLHLHTVKQYSALPYVPFAASCPRYVPRDEVLEYLETYAAQFDLRPRFGEAVRSARRQGDFWSVESTSASLLASHLVIASGGNADPLVPVIAGAEVFEGKILHSADYRNATPYTGQSVLVVGMGNTGAEIALDLAETGAYPTLSVRHGVHIVPRELFGVPIQLVAMLATRVLPLRANDTIFPFILDLAVGNLTPYGIKRPRQGLLAQIATSSRIPVIDVDTVRNIKTGAIKIAPGIREITAGGALFVDGTAKDFDAIVLATGYRPNFQGFLGDGSCNGSRAPDLHFVGFENKVTGLLNEIAKEAMSVAETIRLAMPPPA